VSDTKDVKFVVISRLKRVRSTFPGVVKSWRCCMPALRKMQSIVGWDLIVLVLSAHIDLVGPLRGECAYVSAKEGMASKSAISNTMLEALSSPCFDTNSSRRSLRRPTAETLTPELIRREAIEAPMPDVAPTRSTCLYGKDILAVMDGYDAKVEKIVN